MTKKEFRSFSENRIVYLDGATGSNLQKRGMPIGVCPEEWIASHIDIMKELQKEYLMEGSQILYAPTFTCNRIKLEEYGLAGDIVSLNKKLVQISKDAIAESGKEDVLVAGDLTMTGQQLEPMGKMKFEELIDIYKEQVAILTEAGVDLFVIETMMSLQEVRAALLAVKETCDLPVMVSFTFEADGRTLYGTDAKTAAIVAESLGADAVGANCSTGPDKMTEVIRQMAETVTIPIIAKPNAGLPSLNAKGETVYDMDETVFAEEMMSLVKAGASILGGCCGTTPKHIKSLVEKTRDSKATSKEKSSKRFLTSERQTVEFDLEDNFIIVGERINPTGKKLLQAELREGKLDRVLQFAEEQELCGAKILDINMGMSGIDEKEMMLRCIQEVSGLVSLPLSIDSSHIDVIEAALRVYPGRALINSISLEKEKFEKLLPLAKKYGAMFILLPLSDEGLPKSLEEKKQIIHTILDKALSLGMKKEDIIVDGLVTTVAANKQAAMETLETIRYCKNMGLATICGLSNISFGLPERSYVNTAFLTLAIQAGLTMAIANPSQELLVNSALATDLLLNKADADMKYIEAMNNREPSEKKETNVLPKKKAEKQTTEDRQNVTGIAALKQAVLKGSRNKIIELTKEALAQGEKAKDILDNALLPAINEVGELFDKGTYFLPQLIASAETMKMAIEYLEPLLMENNQNKDMPTVVIATVKGDIHDIGKNLVALMMKNYGFKVIDLGKDVPKEEIVRAAKENNASMIALSALMTTTMQEMRNVIAYAKEQGIEAKIIIGGAVITQDYADEIHADGYSKDAAEAVKVSKQLLGLS